jgi:hypothetical protein
MLGDDVGSPQRFPGMLLAVTTVVLVLLTAVKVGGS